jgi:NAD(P)-dependent dehydrogenase (short-subunit alcohol dehydrogenase family)
MSKRLDGQVAWISGGASGIGAATARLFAQEGAAAAIADVDVQAGRQLAGEISETGQRCEFLKCDVASEAQVRESIAETFAKFGGLHIVVNCAGIVQVKMLHECTEDEWDRLMAVNVKGIFFATKHSLPHLRKNPRSYVVNAASVSSFVGQASTPAYIASKGAVRSLTQSIALDYASVGLRCNCVCPGITDTPMLREHLATMPDPDEAIRQRVRRVPLNRALQPADIARTILYLACEDSAGVTGTSVVVDGGYLAAAEWDAGNSSAGAENQS